MIVDCFPFFNELDTLEIRLNVLNPVVDRFVLVESTRSHQNNPKPLYYEENKERFASFHDKIIHIVVDRFPPFTNSWIFERHQRNEILKGIQDLQPDDIVIVSDLDEIPSPSAVEQFKTKGGIQVFRQRNFYYFLNCMCIDPSEIWWHGPVMAFRRDFHKPQDLRTLAIKLHAEHGKIFKNPLYRFVKSLINPIYRKKISIIDNGGWHFGFLGGVAKIIEKIEAMAHDEYNNQHFKDREHILKSIQSGKDIFDRKFDFEFITIDETYPKFLQENAQRYQHLIKS